MHAWLSLDLFNLKLSTFPLDEALCYDVMLVIVCMLN